MSIAIHVIGMGVNEPPALDAQALSALHRADWVIGAPRQMNNVAGLLQGQSTADLPALSDLAQWFSGLAANCERKNLAVAVLASGDPLFYGIGAWFSRHYPAEQLNFYPAISSIQAACHLLGLALQDVDVVSLHGRPQVRIRSKLRHKSTLVVLTDKNSTPQVLAQECIAAGFAQSQLFVCEALGTVAQRLSQFEARQLATADTVFAALHITVIKTRGLGGVLPEFPGIADQHFVTQGATGCGMITKREVRLAILSLLQPANDDIVWDSGAGCGAVSVELAHWNDSVQVYAIEHHPQRLQSIKANRQRFGLVGNITIISGRAPAAWTDLPSPNKIFIGGSEGAMTELLTQGWARLPSGGMLVASAIIETSKQRLMAFLEHRRAQQDAETETFQMAINSGSRLAGELVYRPNLPVTLFKFTKKYQVSGDERSC